MSIHMIHNGTRYKCVSSPLASQFILEPVPLEKEGDLPVLLEPLIAAFRQERYIHIQDLYVWNYPMTYENMATVVRK